LKTQLLITGQKWSKALFKIKTEVYDEVNVAQQMKNSGLCQNFLGEQGSSFSKGK